MPIKMVWTRKSEGERDLDEIELATEKVSLASFFPLFSLPLFSFLSSQLLLSPPLPTSLFYPLVHKRICTHPSIPCLFPEMCLYTRELETRGSVKVRFLWMQFRPLYIHIYLSTRTRPMTLHHLVPGEKG